MTGVLMLDSLTRGNTLKQGDKTPLTYKLLDADGDKLDIAGKSATVRLVYPNYLTIGYEKSGLTVTSDDTVTFTIDKIIPARKYHVEIIVDNKFVFPSRSVESKFTIDKSSLGTESNIIEIVGKEVLINAVKSRVDTELQPLVTSLESAQQAEAQRVTAESSRVSAEEQRKTDHANRSAELDGKADKVVIKNLIENGDVNDTITLNSSSYIGINNEGGLSDRGHHSSLDRVVEITDGHIYYVNAKFTQGVIRERVYLRYEDASVEDNGASLELSPQISTTIKPSYTKKANLKFYSAAGTYTKDYIMMVDLTETFGAGNEPTKAEMDRLIEITGYIDGEYALNNKEMLEYLMNADKVIIKNSVENGDFSNGTTGWMTTPGYINEFEIVDNVAINRVTNVNNHRSFVYNSLSIPEGNIVYSNFRFKQNNITEATMSILYSLSGVNLVGKYENIGTDFEVYSAIGPYGPSKNFRILVGSIEADGDPEIFLDYLMLIDLTKTFGKGNEPTKAEMDELIKVTGYIDGEYGLNNKEMLGHLMNGKANKKQEDWITVPLYNGVQHGQSPLKVMKDEMGVVHFKGSLTNLRTGSTAFSVPIGYRPDIGVTESYIRIPVSLDRGRELNTVQINYVGNAYITNPLPEQIAYFDGVSYVAERG